MQQECVLDSKLRLLKPGAHDTCQLIEILDTSGLEKEMNSESIMPKRCSKVNSPGGWHKVKIAIVGAGFSVTKALLRSTVSGMLHDWKPSTRS